MLDYKTFGGNLAVKLDIMKAFDTIDWNFLLKVLEAFGFNRKFCDWIKLILNSTKLSFLVNGKSVGFFPCKRGVRQGDPLSPLLFCLAEDVLSRGISHLVQAGLLKTCLGPKSFSTPSHVLYADDVLVFCKGDKKNLDALMKLISDYSSASGQQLNKAKCKFYSCSISPRKSASLATCLGFSAGSLPFNYLGVPLFKGKPTRYQLQPIVDKILNKFAAWKGSLLSIMFNKSMLLYSFQVYIWPANLLNILDKSIRNFIWSGDTSTRKIVTVAWKKVCSSYMEGGLGIKYGGYCTISSPQKINCRKEVVF